MINQYNLCHTLSYDYWTMKYCLEKNNKTLTLDQDTLRSL